jgi:divalent metal cation (Fe/Co/Zn/Cd) transporter
LGIILLVSITAAINYVVGFISLRNGKKNNSHALIAGGKHLQWMLIQQ